MRKKCLHSDREDFLFEIAQKIVAQVLAELPLTLRERVENIPILLETVPAPHLLEHGEDPDLLGLFCGGDFISEQEGYEPIPSQILLFVKNIWTFSGRDGVVYRDEVRRTLLHEIGHYLGLDEEDLKVRDLD